MSKAHNNIKTNTPAKITSFSRLKRVNKATSSANSNVLNAHAHS